MNENEQVLSNYKIENAEFSIHEDFPTEFNLSLTAFGEEHKKRFTRTVNNDHDGDIYTERDGKVEKLGIQTKKVNYLRIFINLETIRFLNKS